MTAIFQEMFRTGIYKRSQGRITRQVTFAALAISAALGLWRLHEQMIGAGPALQFGIPGLLLLVFLWVAYRIVNLPQFADFLIAVEAEMNKVSWPTRHELFRASVVVLLTMFILAAVLWVFDIVWWWVFRGLEII